MSRRRIVLLFALPLLAAAVALSLWQWAGNDAEAADVNVAVGDIWFCDVSYQGGVCDTTINAGDTVVWDFSPSNSNHTTTHCGDSCDTPTLTPLWDSGIIPGGSTGEAALYPYTFTQPGTYLYFCELHPFLQRGRIIVQSPAATPTRTRTPTPATPAGCLEGDANDDGDVTSVDAAIDLQYDAGLLDEPACFAGADVNDDGQVTSIDAVLILQHVAGLIDEL